MENPDNIELVAAVKVGDVQKVHRLLNLVDDVNQMMLYYQGTSAMQHTHVEIIKVLIKYGVIAHPSLIQEIFNPKTKNRRKAALPLDQTQPKRPDHAGDIHGPVKVPKTIGRGYFKISAAVWITRRRLHRRPHRGRTSAATPGRSERSNRFRELVF